MGILDTAQQQSDSLTQRIKNPFERKTQNDIRPEDFPEGFNIEEIKAGGVTGDTIALKGNLMPHVPFRFGGEQNIIKDYYPGQTEPALHVLGPREKDLTINGRFYDKKTQDESVYGLAQEIQQLIDSIRIRGNIVRVWMGEFQRYAVIKDTDFDLKNIGDITYSITFDVIGFNAPINGKFIEKKKEVPFAINRELLAQLDELDTISGQIPATVPASIADQINGLVSDVAGAINIVTDFVDSVIATTNEIRKSVQRAIGLIKHAQNKIREYKNFLGGLDPFDTSQAVTGRYENASFYSGQSSYASFLNSLLQRFKTQFDDLIEDDPRDNHTVVEGETLQSIASRLYGDATLWKRIYDHNNLQSADIEAGDVLEIPEI